MITLFPIVILIGILQVSKAYVYTEDAAKISLNLAQASYCVNNTLEWTCPSCTSDNILVQVIENRGSQSIIGVNKPTNAIFVAFRGSENFQNWINNMKISKTMPYSSYPDVAVEKGFYESYTYISSEIQECVLKLSANYNTNNVMITGHSLGGALAYLYAFDVMINLPKTLIIDSVITFGSPRVGNNLFVNLYNSYVIPSFRITHYYDIVPHVPEELLGFQHVSEEVWYNEQNTEYKICADTESASCSDSCAPLHCTSTSDHINYMGMNMGSGNC